MYSDDRKYSKEHEWVRMEGEQAIVGITFFAQDELGDVVFVQLPEVGASFAAGDEIGTIESVKAVAELFTPIGGKIVAVNLKAQDSPELLNEDPHGEGWLVRIEPAESIEIDALMDAAAYRDFIAAAS